jgi:hypothetical protein
MTESSHTRAPQRRIAAAAAALACVVLIAGCGAEAAKPKPQDVGGSVEDQLGFTRKGILTAQAKVENGIAACMKAQGFDYIPGDPVAVQAALTGKPSMTDAEFEQQFGYGISTLYGRGNAQSDPNAKYRATLSPINQTAYDQALTGGNPEQTFFHAVDTGDFSMLGGCTKSVTDQAFGGTGLLNTLQHKLDDLDDSILADQRMVKAQAAWTACMQNASGQSYQDSAAIEDEVHKQLEAIVGQPLPAGQVAPDGSYDKAALAKLQQHEVELSHQDTACELKNITPVENVVRAEKEKTFRDTNAQLLSQVKPLGSS